MSEESGQGAAMPRAEEANAVGMPDAERERLFDDAATVLRINDRGHYTVPTQGLYPFQWNWDSCLVSLGLQHLDERRAWTELATLFAHQWDDGMLPHIVFHVHDEGYFPGADVWATGRSVPTTGITQPPVAGLALRRLFERAVDRPLAERQASALLEGIDRWHDWFHRCRDPEGTGLVAIIHPWESGRDNAIDWDVALDRVPTDTLSAYERRDLDHTDAAHRPTAAQYDRFVALVECFRGLDWDNERLHDASPFRVVDPGFNAILARSCADLAIVAEHLGEHDLAARNRERAERAVASLEWLWSDAHGQYLCHDRVTALSVDSASVGGLLPLIADIPAARAAALARRIASLADAVRHPVPSHDPADPRFEPKRYWRAPTWLIVNYLLVDGLRRSGHRAQARRVESASLDLIRHSGFAEYYDPLTGEACGGKTFTWTAAMVLEFLQAAEGQGPAKR